ncbi:thrombomodulin [Xiphophorus couchianus]|uniref:thrombomodulin n=1 Tax=Xiphophorus couchianus TaxID=32473 RepID=UPI001016C00E|nr:thrombomodulin-like [Xiphophorus couchianus]
MNVAAGLFVPTLVFLLGKDAGAERNSGYCIGNSCFTLFRDPGTFSSAQRLCRDQNSHLMTVRTSVSSDVLSVLLGNLTGSYWIGLHRMSGCPDPSEELRGFQWVTKDAESDFVNWQPDPDDSCSAARCVSVNGEENFKWSQTPCDRPAAGFLCENVFTDPCTNLPHTAQQSVLYRTPYGFEVEDVRSATLPRGSIATLFPSKTKYICGTSTKWLQAPWSCEINEGGCEYKCKVDPSSSPVCYCPPGESVSPANGVSCQAEGPDDPCAALRCQQTCYEAGGRHQCGCESGYRLVGGACVDTDECTLAPCEHDCANTHGSYVCSCFKGYRVDEKDPHKCRRHCGKPECPAECDPNYNLLCFCPDGYVSSERGGSVFCIDIDECESHYCEQKCRNTYGGYVCSCYPGFKLVGEYRCREVSDGDEETTDVDSSIFSSSPTSPTDPTERPSAVTAGGLVGIIVSTVFVVVLAVFAAHVLLLRRGRKEEGAASANGETEEDTRGPERPSDSGRDKVV